MSKSILGLVAAIAALAPAPADACKKRHQTPFELFDEATTVAFVTVRKTPSGRADRIVAGAVELVVTRVLKGTKTASLTVEESETSCRASYVLGSDALVFLKPNGFTVGAHDGHLRNPLEWKPIMERWAVTTDAPARAAIVVDAITGPHRKVTDSAIHFLLDEPALLNEVTAEQTARIAKAVKALPKDPMSVMLLVRLRDASAPSHANVPLWAKTARGVLAVTDLATITDTGRLADIIARGRTDADPRRIAAMERCERVHGKQLGSFFRYFAGPGSPAVWTDLAEACRTGKPSR